MVPLFAGVIIAGLGIGALLSAFAARRIPSPLPSRAPIVVLHTPTPVARTSTPAAIARNATQTPEPTATPTLAPTPTVTPTHAPTPTLAPTARATPKRTPSATPTAKPRVAIATAAPTPSPSPNPVALAPRAAVADREAFFAQTLVRRFLSAVANGDDPTAYAALGSSSDSLSEAQYLDPTLRITSMSASHNTDGGTNVQVEMRTVKGQYFGTFAVDATGTRILQHEVIPVGGTSAR